MIKTARLWLLQQLEEQIINLRAENGYELNSNKFIKGFNPKGSTDLPFICYEIGEGRYVPKTDDKKGDLSDATILFALHYVIKSETNKQGELVDASERALNDFRKFVHGAKSINQDKILNFTPNRTTNNISWYITSETPVADNVQGNATASVIIAVSFTENQSSQLTENLQND